MAETLTAEKVKENCQRLSGSWSKRNTKMKAWYNILLLTDNNTDEEMESVVSNDPRTGYNLALHLLTSGIVNHKISIDGFSREQIVAAAGIESYLNGQWKSINRRHMYSGKQSWNRELFSMMLAFGWYAILAPINENSVPPRMEAEIWHPAETYPNLTSDGLMECAHIYTVSAMSANFKVRSNGWKVASPFTSQTTIYDYHFLDESGVPNNITVMGNEIVNSIKETRLTRLPVFVGPVGGLPDTGVMSTGMNWQDHYGESIVATNEGMSENYNKTLTFSQQLLRDTANPRWYEKLTGNTHILRKEDMFKRGAVFTMSTNEDIGTVPMPVIPVELRSTVFDYQAMLQRGLFPYIMYGNIQQQIAGYAMEQVASAALQILTPYHEAFVGVLSDIDTYWSQALVSKSISLPDFNVDTKTLVVPVFVDVSHDIKIPGLDAVKAQTAKTIDPNFRLSTETVIGMFYPEIKDATREMARAHRDDAMSTPEAVSLSQIAAYQEEANALRSAKDTKMAALYDTLANNLLQRIKGQGQQPPQQSSVPPPPAVPGGRPTPQNTPTVQEPPQNTQL
jgi:hypothetical protein